MGKRGPLSLASSQTDPRLNETLNLKPVSGGDGFVGRWAALVVLVIVASLAAAYAGKKWALHDVATQAAADKKAAVKEYAAREVQFRAQLDAAKAEITKTADAAKATAAEATVTAGQALTTANEALEKAQLAQGGLGGLRREISDLREVVVAKADKTEVETQVAALSARLDNTVQRTELVDEVDRVVRERMVAQLAAVRRQMAENQLAINKQLVEQKAAMVELSKLVAPKYK